MDPPYNMDLEKEVLSYLVDSTLVKEDTLFVVEASLETSMEDVEEMGYEIIKSKTYKNHAHYFLQRR